MKPIATDRLVLRMLVSNDAPAILEFGGDRETAYWAGMEQLTSLDDARIVIALGNLREDEPQYGITLKGSDTVIGVVSSMYGMDSMDEKCCFLGYFLSPAYKNQGYMSEAVKALCEELFRRRWTNRIVCEIRSDNLASRRVAEKCGFVQNPAQKHWNINLYGRPLDEFILNFTE